MFIKLEVEGRINLYDILDDGVTTLGRRNRVVEGSAIRVYPTFELELIAMTNGDGTNLRVDRINRQVECLHNTRRIGISRRQRVVAGLVVLISIPYERSFVLTEMYCRIHTELFQYRQDQLVGVRTLMGSRVDDGIDTGLRVGLSVELYRLAFVNRPRLRLVVNRLYLECQHHDRVTTVRSHQRIVVHTLYSQQRIAELVVLAFTDGCYDGFRCVCNWQHVHLQTDDALHTVGVGYRVTIDTGLVDRHELGRVARQRPNIRQCVRADSDAVIVETNDIQVQFHDTITTMRGSEACRVDTGCRVRNTLEVNGVTIMDRALNDVVVLLEHIEVQDDDAITTVTVLERVAVFAGLLQVLTVEVVRVTITDLTVDRRVVRLADNELQAVEHTLTVEIGGVVAVDAFRVQRHNGAVPLVGPHVRQLRRADRNNSIYERVNEELEDRGAITTILGLAVVRVNARRIEGVTEEDELVAFDDMLRTCAVVRFVDSQDKGLDAVTTVCRGERVTVDTGFGTCDACEQVRCSVTDRCLNGIEDLLNGTELNSEEVLLSVDGRIIAIRTGRVEEFLFTAPTVGPVVWQVVLTDSDDGVD